MRRGATIASRVQYLRGLAKPKVTARELDRLTGLREGHVSMLEKRDGDRVEGRTIRLIAKVFGVTMDWIFDGEGREPTAGDVELAVARARRAARAPSRAPRRREAPTGTSD